MPTSSTPLKCGQLKRGLVPVCDPDSAGLKTDLVLVRYDDIAALVRDATNPKLVNITLKTGAKGFLFKGLLESNAARAKLTQGKYVGSYTHEVDCVGFGSTPDNYDTVESLARDRVLAVVPDNNGNYLIYGRSAGLTSSKTETDTANKDTGGAPEITLASDKEKGLADFFVVMDTSGQTPVVDPVATAAAFAALYA